MSRARIVITGLGGVCALGSDAPAIWAAMRAGRSAIGPIDGPQLYELTGPHRRRDQDAARYRA